ncbi:HAD family hydrolase [Vallitalea guaymasensis]|uniref:HAD family hydrolase n=1 Tax=Vallitalea guaymasensis TaxID=1185412 RepID=UPI0023557D9B|nr:HAD family hydrolase [Vallitalea guaymasensis]
MKGIIFDLDQTLIDSSIALTYRSKRQWKKVYDMIPKFEVYEGINELISKLNKKNIMIYIVTSSPKSYCKLVVEYWGWKIDGMICYHDTNRHKPNPEPILKAIKNMDVDSHQIISIGDDPKDIKASNLAHSISVAALWGSQNKDLLEKEYPDYICNSVTELDALLTKLFRINNKNIS